MGYRVINYYLLGVGWIRGETVELDGIRDDTSLSVVIQYVSFDTYEILKLLLERVGIMFAQDLNIVSKFDFD